MTLPKRKRVQNWHRSFASMMSPPVNPGTSRRATNNGISDAFEPRRPLFWCTSFGLAPKQASPDSLARSKDSSRSRAVKWFSTTGRAMSVVGNSPAASRRSLAARHSCCSASACGVGASRLHQIWPGLSIVERRRSRVEAIGPRRCRERASSLAQLCPGQRGSKDADSLPAKEIPRSFDHDIAVSLQRLCEFRPYGP